jgi:hypothetical protein
MGFLSDLCMACFQYAFPSYHPHPRTSFQVVPAPPARDQRPDEFEDETLVPTVLDWEERICVLCQHGNLPEEIYSPGQEDHLDDFNDVHDFSPADAVTNAKKRGRKPKNAVDSARICELDCVEQDPSAEPRSRDAAEPASKPRSVGKALPGGILSLPFRNPAADNSASTGPRFDQQLWVHDPCARFSSGVVTSSKRGWFNVLDEIERGRKIVRLLPF